MKIEKIKSLYKKHRLKVFPAGIALASIFLILAVIYPQSMEIWNNQKKLEDAQNKIGFLDKKLNSLESYNDVELSSKLLAVLSSLPDNRDYANILNILEQLIAKSGFITTGIGFSEPPSKGSLESYLVKLDVKGPKAMVSSLLNNLESSHRIIRISSIEISSTQTISAIDLSLAIEAVYSPQKKGSGDPDSPLPALSSKDEETLAKLQQLEDSVPAATQSAAPRGKSNPFE